MADADPMGQHKESCAATSRTTGKRCTQPPIPGGTVCRYHGGAAPQVKRKAALRLLELVDPAIATLAREMANADKSSDRQRAANSILDRAGMARQTQVNTDDARDLLLQRLVEARELRHNTETGSTHDADTD